MTHVRWVRHPYQAAAAAHFRKNQRIGLSLLNFNIWSHFCPENVFGHVLKKKIWSTSFSFIKLVYLSTCHSCTAGNCRPCLSCLSCCWIVHQFLLRAAILPQHLDYQVAFFLHRHWNLSHVMVDLAKVPGPTLIGQFQRLAKSRNLSHPNMDRFTSFGDEIETTATYYTHKNAMIIGSNVISKQIFEFYSFVGPKDHIILSNSNLKRFRFGSTVITLTLTLWP